MPARTFLAAIHRENNLSVALCPEAGTASQGSTPEEALANLREATELYLEEFPVLARQEPVFLTTFHVNCSD